MGLIAKGSSGSSMKPIEQGPHIAVCNMLIDLGKQYSESFKNSQEKVLIGWEVPDEVYESDGKQFPRTITKRYTNSLNERATLRQDLAAWHGRDFTTKELEGFDLCNIVGTNCLINVIHREGSNGKTYAEVASIMALPKGTQKQALSGPKTIFNLDTDPLEEVDNLPEWIAKTIKQSETYKERMIPAEPVFDEMPPQDADDFGDGDLPF